MHIVVDIGGTNTRIAASSDLESFGEPIIFSTSPHYRKGITQIADTAKQISDGAIESIAIGVPGALDRARRIIFKAPNVDDWSGRDIASDIEHALNTKVVVENDVALVGLGEAHYGAGKGAPILMYMTVSTGVNAARIVRGAIDVSVFNPQTGGQYIHNNGRFEEFGDLISGKAIERKYGKHPKELGKDSPVWEELAEITAIGVYNSIVHWSPDRVVLGGSMFNEIGISVDRVRQEVQRINQEFPSIPDIVHARLGEIGGLYGGLARLKQLRSRSEDIGTS